MTREEVVRRGLLLPALAVMLLTAGCSDDGGTTIDDVGVATTDNANDDGSAAAIPAGIDFQAMGEEFVEAAATGDCETAADLGGWSKDGQNRETSISNCELVTAELAELGEPTATSTREEAQDDGDVTVWVTRDYAAGSQWEMMMVIKKSTAANRDEGWVVSTYSY